jgi:hypothetical protein
MKVYVIYHLVTDRETCIVKVVARESDAKAYVKEYEKDNKPGDQYGWRLADYEEFDLVIPDDEPDLFPGKD